MERTCARCFGLFDALNAKRALYCPTCRAEARKERQVGYNATHDPGRKRSGKAKATTPCGNALCKNLVVGGGNAGRKGRVYCCKDCRKIVEGRQVAQLAAKREQLSGARQHHLAQLRAARLLDKRLLDFPYMQRHASRILKFRVRYDTFDDTDSLSRDGYTCQHCGCPCPPELRGSHADNAPEVDHILPMCLGGAHTKCNTQCLCRACNRAKGGRVVKEPKVVGQDPATLNQYMVGQHAWNDRDTSTLEDRYVLNVLRASGIKAALAARQLWRSLVVPSSAINLPL